MDISELKDGDQLFQRNVFNIRDINTYMSPVIYFGINFWNWIYDRPITPINHCATIYNENGVWIVLEAKITFVRTMLSDKIADENITALYVKRCLDPSLDTGRMYICGINLLGTKYDFVSIIKGFIRQLCNQKIDLETNPNKFKNKKVNCSESNGEQLQFGGLTFNNTKNLDPDDLWKDERLFYMGRLK